MESDNRRTDFEYFPVEIEEMTLYVPEFLVFNDNTMVIEKEDFRGESYVLVNNWKSEEGPYKGTSD